MVTIKDWTLLLSDDVKRHIFSKFHTTLKLIGGFPTLLTSKLWYNHKKALCIGLD